MQDNLHPSGPFDPSGKGYSQETRPPTQQPYPARPYPPTQQPYPAQPYPPAQQPYPPPSYNAYQQPSYNVPPAQPTPVHVTVNSNDGCWRVFWIVLVISVVLFGSCGCAFFTIGGQTVLGAIGVQK